MLEQLLVHPHRQHLLVLRAIEDADAPFFHHLIGAEAIGPPAGTRTTPHAAHAFRGGVKPNERGASAGRYATPGSGSRARGNVEM